jgi:hypothetical protein
MPDLVVFNIVIPRTDDRTGIVHAPRKFHDWILETARRFGGISVVGINLRGLWFDPQSAGVSSPVEDHNNWYKVGVPPGRIGELREYVRGSATAFGQKCLYFERAGEAEFVWDPAHDPAGKLG